MQSVRKGNEMEKKSNKSNMFLAMLLAAALARDFVRAHSVPPIFDSFTGRSSPAPMYLLTMSSCVAGT